MKLPCFLFLLAGMVASRHAATTTNLTTFWSSHLRGVPMPASIKEYLSVAGNETTSFQFETKNPNYNISEDINIFKCHATQKPPETMKTDETTSISLHFLEKDLSNISNVLLYPRFPKHNFGNGQFIPRSIVERFPALKSTNLPMILTQFSLSSNSTATKVIKHTIELCEYATKDDNECVTSLESMIDFVQSTLGKSNSRDHVIQALSTTMQSKYFSPRSYMQPYRIVQVRRLSNLKDVNSAVTCHKAEFPYAVFLCHQRPTTVPYMVTLEGVNDKAKIEASTVCHMNTSEWHPSFAALIALKATPGTPICHFLNQRSVLWVISED